MRNASLFEYTSFLSLLLTFYIQILDIIVLYLYQYTFSIYSGKYPAPEFEFTFCCLDFEIVALQNQTSVN